MSDLNTGNGCSLRRSGGKWVRVSDITNSFAVDMLCLDHSSGKVESVAINFSLKHRGESAGRAVFECELYIHPSTYRTDELVGQ